MLQLPGKCVLLYAAVEAGDDLATGAVLVGAEGAVAGAAGDVFLHRPAHRVIAVVAGTHIPEWEGAVLGGGRASRTPQEGDHLGPVAAGVGGEGVGRGALGHVLTHRPLDGGIEVVRGRHVLKGDSGGGHGGRRSHRSGRDQGRGGDHVGDRLIRLPGGGILMQNEYQIEVIEEVKQSHIKQYVLYLIKTKHKPTYINGILKCIRAWTQIQIIAL